VFIYRDGVEFHRLANKERGQYPAILTKQTWSIKDLLSILRDAVGSLEGASGSILLVRVTTHSAGQMLKLRNVASFGRKLEKRKPSSTFSDQFLSCFAPALLRNFEIYLRGAVKFPDMPLHRSIPSHQTFQAR